MTPIEMVGKLGFEVVHEGEGASREIAGIYCCDLLSIVMGRAKADDCWITVMANVNTVAVAVLADVACVVLSEGMSLDDTALEKARAQNVCVLKTDRPTFETALAVQKQMEQS